MAVRRRRTALRRRPRVRARKSLTIKVAPSVAREIWAIVHLAVGILTILSLQGAFGFLGDMWVEFLRPVLGWGIYIVPGMFILIAVMMFFSKAVHFGASRVLGLILCMTSILSTLHLSVPMEQMHSFAAAGQYGGYIGFVTNFLLLELLGVGMIAATIIFVSMFLISILLIFEVPLKDIARFMVPRVKIEVMRSEPRIERSPQSLLHSRDDDPLLAEEDHPEIMIRKAAHVIYEEDERPHASLAASVEDKVSAELTQSQASVQDEEEYEWEFPSLDLLKTGDSMVSVEDTLLMECAEKIRKKLLQFGIEVVMHEVNVGPTVIQYTLKPHEGVKLSKITTLKNDLALALAAENIRIEAPIPGKSLVGIEVPNPYRATVHLREILESAEFTDARSKLTLPLGRSVSGKVVLGNLESMPHLLIAGATGSGKSVAMNAFLISLLYQNSPKDLRMIMIDPKRVELVTYNSIPHLLTPVIDDAEKAAIALRWLVAEMTRRYKELSRHKVRNIFEFNDLKDVTPLPRIVVVVDELADLMMVAGKEVEASICRIAQMARAVGIHLIIATQRPSVDVITGLIKANIPSRIAFAVSSSIDSRTILDGSGAEDLLGRGDMLYLPSGMSKPTRVQGIFVSTEEIERVTNRVKLTIEPNYDDSITSAETAEMSVMGVPDSGTSAGMEEDDMYIAALELVRETRKASASLFQRRLKVGYARAARLIDLLEENGVVGPGDGAKPRKVLVE